MKRSILIKYIKAMLSQCDVTQEELHRIVAILTEKKGR